MFIDILFGSWTGSENYDKNDLMGHEFDVILTH